MGFLVKLLVVLIVVGMVLSYMRRGAVSGSSMRPAEARELLNIHVGASVEEIRAAHRRMMARVHPDAGGSAGLATRVNAARDILLAELKRRA
jgi:preprotein translocase subunit Sec63